MRERRERDCIFWVPPQGPVMARLRTHSKFATWVTGTRLLEAITGRKAESGVGVGAQIRVLLDGTWAS